MKKIILLILMLSLIIGITSAHEIGDIVDFTYRISSIDECGLTCEPEGVKAMDDGEGIWMYGGYTLTDPDGIIRIQGVPRVWCGYCSPMNTDCQYLSDVESCESYGCSWFYKEDVYYSMARYKVDKEGEWTFCGYMYALKVNCDRTCDIEIIDCPMQQCDTEIVGSQTQTIILNPNGNGNWTYLPLENPEGREHWSLVNNNNGSEYVGVYAANSYYTDIYNFEDLPFDNATIERVTLKAKIQGGILSYMYYGWYWLDMFDGNYRQTTSYKNMTKEFGTGQGLPPIEISETWQQNPITDLDWTVEDVNNYQFGGTLKSINSINNWVVFYQFQLEVEYIE